MFANILKIKSLKLQEFMGAEGTLVIPFNEDYITEFIGDNGKGKSLILNALAFVFCGTDAFGNKLTFASNSSGIESLVSVECIYEEDFEETTLKRILKITSKGRCTGSLYKDSLNIGQVEWEKNCDKDIFLSMINPKYLTSLSKTELRKVLLKILKEKNIDYKSMFNEMLTDIPDELLDDFVDLRTLFLETEKTLKNNEDCFDIIYGQCKSNLNEIKSNIKTKKEEYQNIEKQKPQNDIEPEYIIGSEVYPTEKDAFNDLVLNLNKDYSPENIAKLELFNEKKSLKAIAHVAFIEYKESLKKAELLRQEVLTLQGEQIISEHYISFLEKMNESILSNINKNNLNIEVKFKNKYDKDEFNLMFNDIPYENCSYSEQICSSLLLTDNLMNFLGLNYPVFIDNAECITSLPTLKNFHQIVSLQVAKGYELSRYVDNHIEELKSLKALPMVDKETLVTTRILGKNFDLSE